jgi:hypothetical protein
MAGGKLSDADLPPPADGDSRDAANNGKDGVAKRRRKPTPLWRGGLQLTVLLSNL